jgi:exodeoxyribonuclease VII small subunit
MASEPEKRQGFDEVLAALKQMVERLESGQLSLEAALAAFEDGVRLAQDGARILDGAERRVEILTRGSSDADAPTPKPFETPNDSGPRSG